MAVWIPSNFEEACKRNAGRRKLHMRKRKARADRIVTLLDATDGTQAAELAKAAHGCITVISRRMVVSKATASRDFAIVRRIHRQFERVFGRKFEAKRDRVVWTWNWEYYGFTSRESNWARHKKPVGHFPFDTRKKETEESYCGFNQASWQNVNPFSHMNSWELIRTYGRMLRERERRTRNCLRTF